MTAESLLGQTVSHYRITRKLGAGGMGVVYEAEDTRLGRQVAVKFLSEELQQDAPMLERFQREARAASSLNHPGICTVHSIEQHEGKQFIVMELLEGRTLAERMSRQPFDIDELLEIAIQIADALESAHAKGIVHRDLKPVNLFLSPRGQVKVLDFGLAKIDRARPAGEGTSSDTAFARPSGDDLTMAGTVLGTVHYMSPEQARGQLTDPRTDLFSLGAVLYQMATGSMPFEGDTQAVIFDAILNRDPRPLSEANPAMPPALGQLIEKALEKDRGLRCQSATELKTDLMRLKRKLEAARSASAVASDSKPAHGKPADRSIAVLYFENLSGVKEDEYLRDGITEDILTDLSKIKGLNVFPRTTVLTYRDQKATAAQICQQLRADFALEGSLRRAGNRLRINAQLIDASTGFPAWSERYDREMSDIFEVQDEIAHKIAEALRITLSPQEQAELAAKPTENLQAYDLYLRGRSYARRNTRQDMEFALQMFENAVVLDPNFALAYAAIANGCAQAHYWTGLDASWIDRAQSASLRAVALCAGHPRGARLAGLDPLLARRPRGRAPLRARGHHAQAGVRRRLLPDGARALRHRRLPARDGGGGRGAGRGRQRLQRLHPGPERHGRAGQDRCGAQRAAAPHPGAGEPPARGARGRARPHPPGQQLRRGRARGGHGARGEPGHDPSPERTHRPLQRGLHVLFPGAQGRGAGGAAQGLERRLQGRGVDAARPRPGAAAWRSGVRAAVSGEAGGGVGAPPGPCVRGGGRARSPPSRYPEATHGSPITVRSAGDRAPCGIALLPAPIPGPWNRGYFVISIFRVWRCPAASKA